MLCALYAVSLSFSHTCTFGESAGTHEKIPSRAQKSAHRRSQMELLAVKTEGEASCDEEMEEEGEEERDACEEDDALLGEPALQQTAAYIRTYSKYGYRFMQLTQEAFNLKDDPEIAAMLEQQRLTGLANSLFYKIDEERCTEFMRTFNYLDKTGRVRGPDGEERFITISADLISRALNIPNRGREAQLKNTCKYFKHVLAPGGKATCDGVRFGDIIDPHVQKKARFLQMITVCTYRNRQSRILKTNLARICAPAAEVHNWAALIATDLAAGCRNLSNRNCVCGSMLTRVIHTELGLVSQQCPEIVQLVNLKTSHDITSHAYKRKMDISGEENYEKVPKIKKEKDINSRGGLLENGSQRFVQGKMALLCPNPEFFQQSTAQEPSASSFSSEKEEQGNTQPTNSSSTLSIKSGGAVTKETSNTGESQRRKAEQIVQGHLNKSEGCQAIRQHIEAGNTPSFPSPIPKGYPSVAKGKEQESVVVSIEERATMGGRKSSEVRAPNLNQNVKAPKMKLQVDMGSETDVGEEGKVIDPTVLPAMQMLPEGVHEGTGSSQEKRSFRASYPWYPTEHLSHFIGGPALWNGGEMALWNQALALMNQLRAATVSDKQRLEEAERRAQSSIQQSINLEQAYQALELQMKIQQTEAEAFEIQHLTLLKDQTFLKEKMKELTLQAQSAQAERDKSLKHLKLKEAQLKALEEILKEVGDKTEQESNAALHGVHEIETVKNVINLEDDHGRAVELKARLDAALVELKARKLQLKEVRGENVKLREQKVHLEAAMQDKRQDLDSFVREAKALLPDLEKLTKKYHSYKRSGQGDEL